MSFQALLGSDTESNLEWHAKCLNPTDHMTSSQWCWVLQHTIINSMVCFGVNFALVTASFYGKDDVKLFEFPSTVAGAYALTILIELTLNWLSNGIIMTLEIKNGKVPPLHPNSVPWWPKLGDFETSSIVHYTNLTELVLPSSLLRNKSNEMSCWHSISRFLRFQSRSLPWMLYIGIVLLPVYTAVTYLLYGFDDYTDFPQPQFLVSIFGVLIVFLTMPIWTISTLGYVGYRMLDEQ